MTDTASARWAEVAALFDRLVDLPPAHREAQLAASGAEPAVLQRVRQMLAALDSEPSFLEQSPSLEHGEAGDAAAYSSLATGAPVGAFVIDRLIGRGGMGEVYLAHRAGAGFAQQVALKLVRPEAAARMAQFENERRILAGLEHPGIARLIDGGLTPDGRPYMAMEFVEGRDLVTYATAAKLDLAARLALFRQVCDAVDFAHRNLIVHRDLKPANILVDAGGRVRLLDFGIARLLEDGDGAATQAMLTPEYAAPEQIEGGAITMATDVYALGVVLYELLAGKRPWSFPGLPLPATLKRRFDAEPPLPSVAVTEHGPVSAASLRGDLDAIVTKALRPEPAQRYQSAAQLWADIERHSQREPVLARGEARGYRFRRFVSRHRVAVGAVAAVFLALTIGLVGVAWQARQVALERDQVLVEMDRAEAVKEYLVLMFRTAGENGEESTTAKQVLDQSARRLYEQYREHPQTYGELVETLGALYATMNDYDGGMPLLRGYLASPESAKQPATRANVQFLMADAELRRGNTAEARKQLDAAQAFWQTDVARYRKPLIGSRQIQANIEKEESGLPTSIRTLQVALLESDDYFGRNHIDTANVLNSLGIAYQANGDIDKADAAFRDSWAIYQKLDGERSAAALLTLGNWATVAYRKKDLKRAEDLLVRATTLRRELYGPSAALAAMQANLGKIILRAGRPSDAMAQLTPALAMSRQYTGEQSTLTIALLMSLTEGQLKLGDLTTASATLAQAKDAARASSGEEQVMYALCEGLEARLRLREGKPAEARRLADVMARKITALGEAAAPYAPEVQTLKSEVAAAGG